MLVFVNRKYKYLVQKKTDPDLANRCIPIRPNPRTLVGTYTINLVPLTVQG